MKICASWILAVVVLGTTIATSQRPHNTPPSRPRSPMTRMPAARAASTARTTLRELPGSRDREETVALAPEARHLAREHLIEAVVVADAGECRRIGGQRHRGERASIPDEASRELRGQVLAIGCRAAVTAEHDLAALGQGCRRHARGLLDGRGEGRQTPQDVHQLFQPGMQERFAAARNRIGFFGVHRSPLDRSTGRIVEAIGSPRITPAWSQEFAQPPRPIAWLKFSICSYCLGRKREVTYSPMLVNTRQLQTRTATYDLTLSGMKRAHPHGEKMGDLPRFEGFRGESSRAVMAANQVA